MALTNLTVAEEVLSLSPADRAALAKLLIESLEGDRRTDDAIKAELKARLEQLRSGADAGLSFDEVFNAAPPATHGDSRMTAVLGVPPVNMPLDAVRFSIVADAKKRQGK